MRQKDGINRPRADEHEAGEPAEERRVSELEQRSQQRGEERGVRVGEGVFVEVVEVGDAEVEWCEEGGGGRGEVGECDVDWCQDGAEDDLFGERAGDVVAVALRGVEGLGDGGD